MTDQNLDFQKKAERIQALSLHREANPDFYPKSEQFRVAYLVSVNEMHKVTILPVKMAVNAKIEPTGFGSKFDYWKINREYSPKFIGGSDFPILEKLNRLRKSRWNEYPIALDQNQLCLEIFVSALVTNRAVLDLGNGLNLHLGSTVAGKFVWTNSSDEKKLTLKSGLGGYIKLLPLDPIWYVNTRNGSTGLLKTDQQAETVSKYSVEPIRNKTNIAEGKKSGSPLRRLQPEELARIESTIAPKPHLTFSVETLPKYVSQDLSIKENVENFCMPVVALNFKYKDVLVGPNWSRSVITSKSTKIKRRFLSERHLKHRVESILRDNSYLNSRVVHPLFSFGGKSRDSEKYVPTTRSGKGFERIKVPSQEEIEHCTLKLVDFGIAELKKNGCEIEFDKTWPYRVSYADVPVDASVAKNKSNRFELSLVANLGGDKINFLHTVEKIISRLPTDNGGKLPDGFDIEGFLNGNRFYSQVANHHYAVIPPSRIAPIIEAVIEWHAMGGFHEAEAERFSEFARSLEESGVKWRGGGELRELGKKIRNLRTKGEFDPPSSVRAELRPYQKTGYSWLRILTETGFGGLLADDMGLGKTVQALAVLAYRHLEANSRRPSLLIVPTSLVGNWVREIRKFVPELEPLVLHGPKRKALFESIPDHNLVISTYPLLRNDHEELLKCEYELAILDEAQAVKNSLSKAARHIRNIKARQRIALTGTPVENNLGELWSLFDWLIPGLLGSKREFGAKFRMPIEKRGETARQQLLSARVNPFHLRRTKEEVESDLPPKTEINEIIPFESSQRDFYDSLVAAMNARVSEAIRRKGLESSQIMILDALLKLRQACCDPALVKMEAARKVGQSAKRHRLLELLEELVAEGRKIIVFSQFVGMLNLIRSDIEARGWSYAMLTGQTVKRAEEVAMFQEGDASIFLVSIKAGGVGLNLTAADTVIIYDPWWNPAVERQAMDRAHRIGQDKPVFVYKLIAEGTVEEAILEMQARKKELADVLFEDTGGISELSESDIASLFQPVSKLTAARQ